MKRRRARQNAFIVVSSAIYFYEIGDLVKILHLVYKTQSHVRVAYPLLLIIILDTDAVETGSWMNSTVVEFPDAGKEMYYTINVTNEGTVTLRDVDVTDAKGDISCDETLPVPVLGVGGSFQCETVRQVRMGQ